MKKTLLALASLSFVLTMNAQDEAAPPAEAPAAAEETSPWTREGLFNLSISQTALINWAAGGQNSYSGNALLKYSANYKNGLWKWKNDLAVSYGGLAQGEIPWQKTDDRLEFNSKVSRDRVEGGDWAYAAFLNFRTQFMDGFKLPDDSNIISTWMAPGYLTFGIGMDYTPNEFFTANISPVAGKFTFVANPDLADAGAFGVEAAEYDSITGAKTTDGSIYRFELGGNVSMQFKKEIVKNVELDTKLNLFSNYLEEPGNIDVNWDLMLNMKVNEWLSASLICNLIYDHDIDIAVDEDNDGVLEAFGPRTQFKEVLGVGINMKF